MLIYAFCKICEHCCEPEIVFVYSLKLFFVLIFLNNFRFTTMFATLTKHVNNQTNCCNVWQIKNLTITVHSYVLWWSGFFICQTLVLLWIIWRKYGSVSYSFSCKENCNIFRVRIEIKTQFFYASVLNFFTQIIINSFFEFRMIILHLKNSKYLRMPVLLILSWISNAFQVHT